MAAVNPSPESHYNVRSQMTYRKFLVVLHATSKAWSQSVNPWPHTCISCTIGAAYHANKARRQLCTLSPSQGTNTSPTSSGRRSPQRVAPQIKHPTQQHCIEGRTGNAGMDPYARYLSGEGGRRAFADLQTATYLSVTSLHESPV